MYEYDPQPLPPRRGAVLLPLLAAAAVGLERIIRVAVRTPDGAERVLVLVGWLWGGAWTIAQVARTAM